jgi:hypothetical protein
LIKTETCFAGRGDKRDAELVGAQGEGKSGFGFGGIGLTQDGLARDFSALRGAFQTLETR